MATLYETIEEMCRINEIDVTTMCRESGASRGSMTDLKKGRIATLTAETLDKLARYFHVTIDFLLDPDDNKYDKLGGGQWTKKYDPDPIRDEARIEVMEMIVNLPDDDVQKVAEYIDFLKSRGGK